MSNALKLFLIGWLTILTIGLIGVSVYTSRRSILVERALKGEIKKIRKEIEELRKDVNSLKKKISVRSEEISNIDTTDWKTYRNKKWGFELRYPKTWYINEADLFIAILDTTQEVFPMMSHQKLNWMGVTIDCSYSKPPELSWTEWLKRHDIAEYEEIVRGEIMEIKVKKVTGIDTENTFLVKGDKICGFRYYSEYRNEQGYDLEKLQECITIFNQILSTFKFLDGEGLSPISEFKTYSNPEANFTFKYPTDWEILADYFYETAGGIKAKSPTVILRRKGDENSNNYIHINSRQFQCMYGKCKNIEGNEIATYGRDPEVEKTFRIIIDTFKVKKWRVNSGKTNKPHCNTDDSFGNWIGS